MTRQQRGQERSRRVAGSGQATALRQIRPMAERDIAAVLSVERAAYHHPWGEGLFRDSLRAGHHCWLIEWNRRIVAHGIMMIAAGEAHLLNLCVHPEQQRCGIGRQMLRHLLHLARRHDADMALLEVRPSNLAAIALYETSGFNEIGRRPDYYPALHGREDALMMARSLIDGERTRGEDQW
jgi:ribosomal-protein-alanine N-acetyltransferase